MILISLIIPSLGFQSIFLNKELSGQIVYLVSNLIFSSVVYYPFACGIVYLFKIITGKEKVKVRNLVIALLFIIIFNIITFSIVATKIIKNNQVNSPFTNSVIDPKTKEKLCGLQIVEVTAPSAKNAGLVVGEVIKTINDYPVENMEELTHALANKRPNDIATVITNANTYNVALFANPQNSQQVLMGIKVKPTECKK
jgi:predicted permease